MPTPSGDGAITIFLLRAAAHTCVSLTLTLDTVEGVARVTEARLKREVSEGKIIDFRRSEVGFDVIRMEAMNSKQNKVSAGDKRDTALHSAPRQL